MVTYVSEEDQSQRLLFLINPTAEPIEAKLSFTETVTLTGLPQSNGEGLEPIIGKTFELAIPQYGVLSMQLGDASQTEIDAEPTVRPDVSGMPDVNEGENPTEEPRWS